MKVNTRIQCAGFSVAFLGFLMGIALPWDSPTEETPQLPALLEKLGKSVELFREQFPAVACTEKVSQVKLGDKGNVVQRLESQFDYLIFMKLEDNDLWVEESRIQKNRAQKPGSSPLLISNGFATLMLIFHPVYQDCYEFSQLSEERVEGRRLLHLHFQHIQGTRSTAALRIGTKDEPLDMKGNAWIEPDTASVVRIAAELSVPLSERGLHMFSADVHYSPIRFESAAGDFWLPSSATIEVGTRLQHWRNNHWFTDYRRFSVSAESVIKK